MDFRLEIPTSSETDEFLIWCCCQRNFALVMPFFCAYGQSIDSIFVRWGLREYRKQTKKHATANTKVISFI